MDSNSAPVVWHHVSKFIFDKNKLVVRGVHIVHNAYRLANDFILDYFIVDIAASRWGLNVFFYLRFYKKIVKFWEICKYVKVKISVGSITNVHVRDTTDATVL